MRAKEFEIKKRDPNWRAMQDIRRSGAGGQHKDKKKAEKQGYEKHKNKGVDEGIGGMIAGGVGQFIGNKIDPLHGEIMRAHGEMAGRKAEYTIRKYMHLLQKALKQQLDYGEKEGVAEGLTTEKQIMTRIRQIMHDRKISGTESNAGELLRLKQQLKDLRSQQSVEEGDYPDGSSIKTPDVDEWKQQYQQAVMAVKNAKTKQEYEAASDRAGRIKDLLASKGIKVGPVLGQQDVEEGSDWGEPREILEDVLQTLEREVEWPLTEVMDPKEVKQLLAPLVKAVNDKMMSMEEGRRDYGYDDFGNSLRPGDDEGSTEPPNNFAIYINDKKWKVFKGQGHYADDQYEMAQFRRLQQMASKKSQETGKKWEVVRTGEPATK